MTVTTRPAHDHTDTPLAHAPAFMETQFPVAKLSMESYRELKAGNGQTLTGLGKWWGRKPLVLVRAAILGLLLPATDDPVRDREIFLKLMTMDEEGLRRRKSKAIPSTVLVQELQDMPPSVRRRYLADDGQGLAAGLSREDQQTLQLLVFDRLSYGEKLAYCDRPEQIDGPSPAAWAEINAHPDTHAQSLPQLVEELGMLRFGRRRRVETARALQQARFTSQNKPNVLVNGDMGPTEVQQFYRLDQPSSQMIRMAVERMGLSARAYHRILKLARAIADLAGSEKIQQEHLAEALQYRPRTWL